MLLRKIELIEAERESDRQKERQLQDKINGLTQDLQFYARNADTRESMLRIERLREERDAKELKITEHVKMINDLQRELENVAAENRTLRKLAAVPDNYGIDLAGIKLNTEKKIESYTKLIKVLQDDNYMLEEERARLKNQLKQMSMLYTGIPKDRYADLSDEHLFEVDQFVMRLKAGEPVTPGDCYELKKENSLLKAQLEALNTKGFEFARATIEAFLKELGLNGEDGGKLFEKLKEGNKELKQMIQNLFS